MTDSTENTRPEAQTPAVTYVFARTFVLPEQGRAGDILSSTSGSYNANAPVGGLFTFG